MRKIILSDKRDIDRLAAAFPQVTKTSCYNALAFRSHSVMASRIRCYAMNFLASAELLTTK